jgi:hypothetical protein
MKRIGGLLMLLFAAMIGVVEFRAIVDPAVAQSVSSAFAAHDPFPRLPWDYHVTFILLFAVLVASGLHLVFRRSVHGTSRI